MNITTGGGATGSSMDLDFNYNNLQSNCLSPAESDRSYFDSYFDDVKTPLSSTTFSFHSAKSSIDSTTSRTSSASCPLRQKHQQRYYQQQSQSPPRKYQRTTSYSDRQLNCDGARTDHPSRLSNDVVQGPNYVKKDLERWLWETNTTTANFDSCITTGGQEQPMLPVR